MSDIEKYVKLVENVIRRAGLEPGECYDEEQECWQFVKGSADIFITLIEIGGEHYVNIASPVMAAPRHRREKFFQRLLEENALRIAVKFSLRDDVAWLEINREMKGLGFDEAMRALVRVAEVADELDQILVNEYGDDWDA
ncbi:MAG: YbjN domain-containing protein [Candidatus Coatesbacteria bacterium]|nr:MAG: YbjN domain-containing protein [Candidatus Coatesbacteria bacterium]